MSRTQAIPPITLAQLLHARVVDESGRDLGRVHDVRAIRDGRPAEAGQAARYRVEGLIVGRPGLRARFGLTRARRPEPLQPGEPIRWEHVVAVEPGRVVVRDNRT
jgi:hypothetical protein